MNEHDVFSGEELAVELTWREQDVLALLAKRMTNREIAARLHLAESTVKDYVGRILSKLYVKNRRQAVEQAKALGLLGVGQKTKVRPPTNLPSEPTPFMGRVDELKELRQQLGETRLLTLTGPGGIGKTRLALKVAEDATNEINNGSHFVSLASIGLSDDIAQTIAEGLNIPVARSEDSLQQLLRYLKRRSLLLVIDNFEHLLDGVGIVSKILQVAPGVKILATSRERLNIKGETNFIVTGMRFPNQGKSENILNYDAITLFINSARRIQPSFDPSPVDLERIASISQIVRGMPLAIELAAAWLHILSLDEIADELEKGLDILLTEMRDVPERHRSIRSVFDHSWSLLDQTEREIFMLLSVFRGGFTREAAQHVTGASLQLLSGLVNKSMLRYHTNTGRFEIHELLKQYAQERLGTTPQASIPAQETHANFYAEFMNIRWQHLRDSRQFVALHDIDSDIENIRTAWRFHLEKADAQKIRLFIHSFRFVYWIRGWNLAAVELYRKAADALCEVQDDVEAEAVRATAMANQGFFMAWLGLADQGYRLARESVEILERLNYPEGLFFAYNSLSLNAYYLNRMDEDKETTDKLLETARTSGEKWRLAFALFNSGFSSFSSKNYLKAKHLQEASLRLSGEIEDEILSSFSLITLGHIAIISGEIKKAKEYYLRSLRISKKAGFRWMISNSIKYLGRVALLEGEVTEAEKYFLRSLRITYDISLDRDIANHLYEFAKLRIAQNRSPEAAELLVLLLRQPVSHQVHLGGERIRDNAQELLAILEDDFSPKTFATSLERGQKLDLDEVILELIGPKR
ncbi:MAG: LuxR C-terminal-related transcriptional regulator [Anaerolineales bacterium]|jgi:predicted ATPase/DNA-binding CsgD family transcriptional regulator/tetratricopeptide (TPR) repeat protein